MPSAYDQTDRYVLRADFKKEHFDCSTTNFDLLFKKYHASNLFYRNTKSKDELMGCSREFYDIYKTEILDKIEADKKYMLSVDLRNCRDLIQMEYMQKSPLFNSAYSNMYMRLKNMIQDYQRVLKQFGVQKRNRDALSLGEVCFILYLNPEFEDVVKYMLAGFKLTEAMQAAIEKSGKQQKQNAHQKHKKGYIDTKNLIIREAWQVGKIK